MINLLPFAIYFAPLVKVSFLSLLSTSSLFFRNSIMLCLGMNFFVFINCLGFSQLLESVSLSFAWFGKFQPLCLRKKTILRKKDHPAPSSFFPMKWQWHKWDFSVTVSCFPEVSIHCFQPMFFVFLVGKFLLFSLSLQFLFSVLFILLNLLRFLTSVIIIFRSKISDWFF